MGIGISQWRSARSQSDPAAPEPHPPFRKRLPSAASIGAGVAAIVVMTLSLLADL
ncbi:MAG: hypothetical protein AB7I38_03020 [Dehalococcoidia bacterium]